MSRSLPLLSTSNTNVVVAGNKTILADANVDFAAGKLHAVVGPSGCGKTTLMKAILGMIEADGEVYWNGQRLSSSEQLTGRVGWIPQFSIAFGELTILESLHYCAQLFVVDFDKEQRVHECLELVGLLEHKDKLVNNLSGGQMRRLGLALELVGDPELLICDEVTSGLDPNSEEDILQLLRSLCEKRGKTIICIIHNLSKLPSFDSVTVLQSGRVLFQGSYPDLADAFQLEDPLFLYNQLDQIDEIVMPVREIAVSPTESTIQPISKPTAFSQMGSLLARRFKLFFRDRSQLLLTAAITVGFPLVVVIFAWNGLPQLEWIDGTSSGNVIADFQENIRFQKESAETASLVTGLIMFQVVLLTLMASNTGAREIAASRMIWEKERLNGLSPFAFVMSKLFFTGFVAIIQGVWMTVFVKSICNFPGGWAGQIVILSACSLAMTWLCLGFSAMVKSAEKASLLSIYLVGFQLPLSGVFLGLPEFLAFIIRPFINAYWSWSGYMSTMKASRVYDAFRLQSESVVPDLGQNLVLLCLHMAVGITLVMWGTKKRQEL